MGVFFIYILKSSVCLVLFYLFFRLLLSKETFHRFNRMALLGVLFFSLLIPCIAVTTRHQVEVQQAVLSIEQLLLMAELETTPANAVSYTHLHQCFNFFRGLTQSDHNTAFRLNSLLGNVSDDLQTCIIICRAAH